MLIWSRGMKCEVFDMWNCMQNRTARYFSIICRKTPHHSAPTSIHIFFVLRCFVYSRVCTTQRVTTAPVTALRTMSSINQHCRLSPPLSTKGAHVFVCCALFINVFYTRRTIVNIIQFVLILFKFVFNNQVFSSFPLFFLCLI